MLKLGSMVGKWDNSWLINRTYWDYSLVTEHPAIFFDMPVLILSECFVYFVWLQKNRCLWQNCAPSEAPGMLLHQCQRSRHVEGASFSGFEVAFAARHIRFMGIYATLPSGNEALVRAYKKPPWSLHHPLTRPYLWGSWPWQGPGPSDSYATFVDGWKYGPMIPSENDLTHRSTKLLKSGWFYLGNLIKMTGLYRTIQPQVLLYVCLFQSDDSRNMSGATSLES